MMQSYGDDLGSNDGSSDNDQNEEDDVDELEDGDGDQDIEDDEQPYGEGNGEENDENDEEEEYPDHDSSQQQYATPPRTGQERPSSTTQTSRSYNTGTALTNGSTHSGPTSQPRFPGPPLTSLPHNPALASLDLPRVRPEALTAPVYDIVPTIAAPHSTSINAITATPDLRWVFSGGADGYIRKFNWVETANGKVMLTVAQRHPFVDSVTKAGVLTSYWENEEPQSKPGEEGQILSSVYSLAVQNKGLWLLSGLKSGGINLQSVRHEEGKRITCLKKHSSAVSVLNLAQDERSFLSGSWDKIVLDWDLDTGQVKRSFEGSGGQISALEMRPFSSLPVPETSSDSTITNGTMTTNNTSKPTPNGIVTNGNSETLPLYNSNQESSTVDAAGSPADSLFGGNDGDSLFGDNDDDNTGAPPGGNFGDDDDDEFSRAIANGLQQQDSEDVDADNNMVNPVPVQAAPLTNGNSEVTDALHSSTLLEHQPLPAAEEIPPVVSNGLPHAEELHSRGEEPSSSMSDVIPTADSTFLAASTDGTVRVWDKRRPTPIAKIVPQNVPPWCMNACWSPDGNFIYAGRRNGTVEEFSLHKGLRGVERTFKFPNGSGAVSAVRAMPNGRHLICASFDILRLYDLQQQQTFKHSTVPFLIVPGHRTGVVSQLYIDPTCRYMISTAGNRGWDGISTEVLLGYEIVIGV